MMPFRFAFLFASLSLLCALVACAGQAPYAIEATAANLAAGTAGQAQVRFVPGPGFKWNDEFPAAVKIVNPGTIQVARRAITRAEGDFASQDGTGILRFAVSGIGRRAGRGS